MPIIIDRHTGKVISIPETTQQQKNLLLEEIIKAWLEKNPEKFKALLVDKNDTDCL